MTFTVLTLDDALEYTDTARFNVDVGGVLTIDDGKGRRRIYAPGAWRQIDTATPLDPSRVVV